MTEYGIPTNNDYTIREDNVLPPLIAVGLYRTVGHTPLNDSRGVMTCDCYAGNDCCNYDHWRYRWVLVDSHPGNCMCHSCNRRRLQRT